jgi:iron complex outermembrane receptor protein
MSYSKLFNIAIMSALAASNSAAATDKKQPMEEIVITGIAGAELPLSSIPGAAQVIGHQEILEQMSISPDIADMMANLVPAYSPSNQLASNFGQTFRGKKAVVLIDGVLQTTPIRNASREFMTIAPEALETVEIIHGSSALYGNGYAGGVVNFVTRQASDTAKAWSSVETNFQPDGNGDTFGWGINQGFSGPLGRSWNYVANFNYKDTGKFVDADGNILPEDQSGQGGYANGNQYDILLKLGYRGERDTVDVTLHSYDMTNGLTYERMIDPVTGFTVIDTSRPYTGKDPSNEIGSITVKWIREQVLGQTFSLQASVGDNTYNYATTLVESKKYKLVPQFVYQNENESFRVIYGIDFEQDNTTQKQRDNSSCWICDVTKTQTSPFAQAWYQLTPELEAQLGVRHESYNYDVPSYLSVRGALSGQIITGGDLDYSETTFNGGLVYHLTDNIDLFGGYSEGYAVDDLRRLRGPVENSVEEMKQHLPATKSHNIEVGVRGQTESTHYSLALFQTRTNDAAHYGQTSDGAYPLEFLIYADEEIYGIEATFDYAINENWTVGGSYAYSEGEYEDEVGNTDRPLNGTRITPEKLTAFISTQITPSLSSRIQVLNVSNRDEFDELDTGGYYYYESPIDGYTTVDALLSYNLQQKRWGTLSLSARNLLNKDYSPVSSQVNQENARTSVATAYRAQGRAVSLKWSIEY